ncbi:MAG TPA: hypothetical protein DEP28_03675 [Bacteroidetes bacterium]|nr:hypothetical protein [Bacteroidota bacterium]HRI47779.1 hypothetical protein [Ignavibacteriaceae bacterium]
MKTILILITLIFAQLSFSQSKFEIFEIDSTQIKIIDSEKIKSEIDSSQVDSTYQITFIYNDYKIIKSILVKFGEERDSVITIEYEKWKSQFEPQSLNVPLHDKEDKINYIKFPIALKHSTN